jgi:hypothetical protein
MATFRRFCGLVFFLLLFSFIPACGYPQIRVKNDSPQRLDDIRVYSGERVREFGSLGAGEATAYTTVGEATEWERIEAKLGDGGGELLYEPSPNANPGSLDPGFWTYHLRVDLDSKTGQRRLRIHLSRDAYPPDW